MYLQLDGVDDALITDNPVTIDQVVYDLIIYSDGSDYGGHLINEEFSKFQVRGTTFAFTPAGTTGAVMDKRTTLSFPVTQTTAIASLLSRYNTGTPGDYAVKADLFDVKLYNAGTLVAHYDMSTGTAQDQSGNGNHATLTGGTWVSDTPTGTDVTYDYAMRQTIYADRSAPFATVQRLFADVADSNAMEQRVYANRFIDNVLQQRIWADRTWDYATKQVFYSDYLLYSADFPLRQIIFADTVQLFALEQAIYADRQAEFTTLQRMYEAQQASFELLQVIYRNAAISVPTVQRIFADRVWNFATLIKLIDYDKSIIGRIDLQGSIELIIHLLGSRELVVNLKGGVTVTQKNQNFYMYAGDSKSLVVAMPDTVDLTGASIKWVLRRSSAATNDISKQTGSGIANDAHTFTVQLEPDDTLNLSGDYVHEAEVTDAQGNVSTVMIGRASIKPSFA